MSIISLWLDNNLNLVDGLVESMIRQKPKIVMLQDVPYLTDEELESLLLDRLDCDYSLYRKNAGELNRVGDHIADNFMLIRTSEKVEVIHDCTAREWMQDSSVNIFGIMMEVGNSDPPGTYLNLDDKYRVPVFSVLVHEAISDVDAIQNVYWIQKMLTRENLDPDDAIIMGHYYDDTFPKMLQRILGINSLGQTMSRRRSNRTMARSSF